LIGDSCQVEIEQVTPIKKSLNQTHFQFKEIHENHINQPIESNDEVKENPTNPYKIKKLTEFGNSCKEEIIAQLEIMSGMPLLDIKYFNSFQITLSDKKGTSFKKTLLIDLDETLIHSFDISNNYFRTNLKVHTISAKLFDKFQQINFVIRPFLNEFLEKLSEKFELFVNIIRFIPRVLQIMQMLFFLS